MLGVGKTLQLPVTEVTLTSQAWLWLEDYSAWGWRELSLVPWFSAASTLLSACPVPSCRMLQPPLQFNIHQSQGLINIYKLNSLGYFPDTDELGVPQNKYFHRCSFYKDNHLLFRKLWQNKGSVDFPCS